MDVETRCKILQDTISKSEKIKGDRNGELYKLNSRLIKRFYIGKNGNTDNFFNEVYFLHLLKNSGFTPTIYQHLYCKDSGYIEMEFINGITLKEYFRHRLPFTLNNAFDLKNIIDILHNHYDVCHNDLHADNIIVIPLNDSRLSFFIIDFEISNSLDNEYITTRYENKQDDDSIYRQEKIEHDLETLYRDFPNSVNDTMKNYIQLAFGIIDNSQDSSELDDWRDHTM
jgi:tRNA A-37 threonylcarbamoyl transferase component Bud32